MVPGRAGLQRLRVPPYEEAFDLPHGGFIHSSAPPCRRRMLIHLWAAAGHLEAFASRLLQSATSKKSVTDSYAARTMRMSGVLILLILIFRHRSLHHREPAPRRSPISAMLTSPLLTTA